LDLAKHKWVETCKKISLKNVSIIQAATLYKEISDDCKCKMKKKFLEATMGPISDSQLTLAPPCWMVQVDLFGDDQQGTRAKLKLAGWTTKMESIRTTYQMKMKM
jgi:hypothetical protein